MARYSEVARCLVCHTIQATDPPESQRTAGYGITPSISASSPDTATDAVVWALIKTDGGAPKGTGNGALYAYDALTMASLYNSGQCVMGGKKVDQIAQATKFSVPTVANGYVYLGTQGGSDGGAGTFYIFGTTRRTCS